MQFASLFQALAFASVSGLTFFLILHPWQDNEFTLVGSTKSAEPPPLSPPALGASPPALGFIQMTQEAHALHCQKLSEGNSSALAAAWVKDFCKPAAPPPPMPPMPPPAPINTPPSHPPETPLQKIFFFVVDGLNEIITTLTDNGVNHTVVYYHPPPSLPNEATQAVSPPPTTQR